MLLILLSACGLYTDQGAPSAGACPDVGTTTELVFTDAEGRTAILTQEEGTDPDAPAFWGLEGPETGNISVSEGLGLDYIVLGFHGGHEGAGEGSVCRDFQHSEESEDCSWFEFGTGEIHAEDGTLIYDTLEQDTLDGSVCVEQVDVASETVTFTVTGAFESELFGVVELAGTIVDATTD